MEQKVRIEERMLALLGGQAGYMTTGAPRIVKDLGPLCVCPHIRGREIGDEKRRQQKVGFADFTRRIYPLFRREGSAHKAGQVRIGRLSPMIQSIPAL